MATYLSLQTVNNITQHSAELKTRLRIILNCLDGLFPYMIANLYEGLIREQAETQDFIVHKIEQSVDRYTNCLQNARDNLQRLRFDANGHDTETERNSWNSNTMQAIQSQTVNVPGKLKEDWAKDELQMLAEQMQLSCSMIKRTLDTIEQPRVNFQENYLEMQNRLAYLKDYIPTCIEAFNVIESHLSGWSEVFGLENPAETYAFQRNNFQSPRPPLPQQSLPQVPSRPAPPSPHQNFTPPPQSGPTPSPRPQQKPSVPPRPQPFNATYPSTGSSSSSSNRKLSSDFQSKFVGKARANAIGIDIGTSSSCVAVFTHGKVEVIPNGDGGRTTPSYVAFTGSRRLVGDSAKNQGAMNSPNTVFDAKRLIDHKFTDPIVQSNRKYWPFELVNDSSKPKILVKFKEERKIVAPKEVSALVLHKMKAISEEFLGQPVTNAVITVPACFNDAQRQATKDAAAVAGLGVLRIITDSTAAALTFGMKKSFSEHNVLVFDLGAGFCSVSIVTIEDTVFEVNAIAGDNIGGRDFDSRMVENCVAEFKRRYDKDISSDSRAMIRLRNACEQAKKTLSTNNSAAIEVDSLLDGKDLYTSLTRGRFEELCADLFRKTLEPVEKALRDGKMEKSQIHDIVLVGGSTRLPMIQKLLSEFFNGKELNKSVNAEEGVAIGAAFEAAILSADKSPLLEDMIFLDATPFSLGIETAGGVTTTIIKRNVTIPTKTSQTFTRGHFITNHDSRIVIQIFEGERAMTRDNNLLGKLELSGISAVGDAEIEITFDIDANGILNVIAKELSTGKTNKVQITKSRLSEGEIERMAGEIRNYKDDNGEESIQSRESLESYALNMKRTLENGELKDLISEENHRRIASKCDEILRWLDSNQAADKEEYDEYQNELETFINNIFTANMK